MVTIKKKQFLITLTENWFGYSFSWSDLILPACYRGIRDVKKPFYFGFKKKTVTAVLPLEKSIEEIYAGFFTSNKRDIKKAEAEEVQCFFTSDIKTFVEFYNEFAKSKNVDGLDPERINELSGDAWKFSFATLNGDLLVVHSYLMDKDSGIVRSMQSGSKRLNDKYNPRQIARANKLLHYFDIKYFKQEGLRFYDFGGWDNFTGLLEFKQSFGASPIDVVNYFTWTYQVKEWIKDLPGLLKKANINRAKTS